MSGFGPVTGESPRIRWMGMLRGDSDRQAWRRGARPGRLICLDAMASGEGEAGAERRSKN